MKNSNKLEIICNKYCGTQHNEGNYSIGGGLDNDKFASRRHEDARDDEGKLTFGEATQLFKKATGLKTDIVREVIKYAVPNMEWHHAGLLPKSYGGGMKKTYFLNAGEICNVAKNWNDYFDKLTLSNNQQRILIEEKNNKEEIKLKFLKENASKVFREIASKIQFALFYETDKEMDGKYGWFISYGKSYKMDEYYSGWQFENEEMYHKFLKIL